MSLLAINSLFIPHSYDPTVISSKLARVPRDIFLLIIPHLTVEKFEMVALQGCHKWSIWMRDFAREVVRTRWPELFMEFDHPRRNWVALYCAKTLVEQNMLEGRCEFYRLVVSFRGGPHYTYGMEFGKFSFPRARYRNDSDITQLGRLVWKVNGKIKCWAAESGLVHYENSQEGWHTDVIKYQNRTLILCYLDENFTKGQPYLFDPSSKKLQRVVSPVKEAGFVNGLRLTHHDLAYFPQNTLGLMWTIEKKGVAEEQVFASYPMNKDADELYPTISVPFPLAFPGVQYKVQSAYAHEGYVIVFAKGFPTGDKYLWFVFESSPTLLLRREKVGHVLSLPGKIFLFSESGDNIAVEVLNTQSKESQELILPFHNPTNTNRLPAWIYPINASKIMILGLDEPSKTQLKGCLLNVKDCELTELSLPKVEITIRQLANIFFDGEKLLLPGNDYAYGVLNFGSRHPTQETLTKKVEGALDQAFAPFVTQTETLGRWSLRVMSRWGLNAIGIILLVGVLYYSRKNQASSDSYP